MNKEKLPPKGLISQAIHKENPTERERAALCELLDKKPEIWKAAADLVVAVQENILKTDSFGTFFGREAFRRKLAAMRDDLGWQSAGEMERLLIEQVCLNWFRHNLLENLHQTKTYEKHDTETGLYWEKRLDMSHKRYLRSLETLAKVRKYLAEAEFRQAQAQGKRSKAAQITKNLLKNRTDGT